MKIIFVIIFIFVKFLFSQEANRTAIAVLDFSVENMPLSDVITLTNVVRRELIKMGSFSVVDEGNMRVILEEQSFQQTGCISDECIVQAGKLLNVQKVISGVIRKRDRKFIIDIKITDVQTGKKEKVKKEEFIGEIEYLDKAIAQMTKGLFEVSKVIELETSIYVDTEPRGAKVYIDTSFVGSSPVEIKYSEFSKFGISGSTYLEYSDFKNDFKYDFKDDSFDRSTPFWSPAAQYRVIVEASGYKTWSDKIFVKRGEKNLVVAKLDKLKPGEQIEIPKWHKLNYSIGISGGFISGVGFSFRKLAFDGNGFQISGLYTTEYQSAGLQLLSSIYNKDDYRIYFLVGIGYNKNINNNNREIFAVGGGFGAEFFQFEQIVFAGELTIAVLGTEVQQASLIPFLPQIGVYYYLK
jgi:TolB-like protein